MKCHLHYTPTNQENKAVDKLCPSSVSHNDVKFDTAVPVHCTGAQLPQRTTKNYHSVVIHGQNELKAAQAAAIQIDQSIAQELKASEHQLLMLCTKLEANITGYDS